MLPHLVLACLSAQQTPLSPEQVYKNAVGSVMTLKVERADGSGTGTAFLALRDGVAVTAWHVVNGAKRVVAKFSSGEEFEVSGLIDKDEARDVALVKVKVADRALLTLAAKDPEVASKAFVIGAPRGLEFSITDGLISQIQNVDGVKQYQFSCPASPGNSGGPLFDGQGAVLGVVSWQRRDGQNLNFAVPVTYVRGLDSSLSTVAWGAVKESRPAATVADLAEVHDAMVKGMWAVFTASAAMRNAGERIIYKNNGFKAGVTLEQLESLQELGRVQEKLEALEGSSEASDAALYGLLSRVVEFRKALLYQKAAIDLAQAGGGWINSAEEKLKLSIVATNGAYKSEGFEAFAAYVKTEAFLKDVPPDLLKLLQPKDDGFRLDIMSWPKEQLRFAAVLKDKFGYRLGFRTGDALRSVDGKTVSDLYELRAIIKENLGKTVRCVVWREGKEKNLDIKIPKELPKDSLD